jgi:hypothetical protein
MDEKQIQQNLQMSVNFLVSLLKKNWQNVSADLNFFCNLTIDLMFLVGLNLLAIA